MSDAQEVEDTDFRIPLPIRTGLIGIHVVVALFAFSGGFGVKQLTAFGLYVVTNIGLLPLVFVVIGLVGKLLDRSFRLENAYYLGLLMSLVLVAQKM
jgi:hypothetical protein